MSNALTLILWFVFFIMVINSKFLFYIILLSVGSMFIINYGRE